MRGSLPHGAMQKREKDGIVFVEKSLCVGCKTCMSACPWGAPQWNPETGKVVKCDYCKDRVDLGLKPACATICTTHCLHFGRPEEVPPSGGNVTLRPWLLWSEKIILVKGSRGDCYEVSVCEVPAIGTGGDHSGGSADGSSLSPASRGTVATP